MIAYDDAITGPRPGAIEQRFNPALDIPSRHERVQSDRIAALGGCFGGGVVLHIARTGIELAGIGSMHGTLSSPVPAAGSLKTPLVVHLPGNWTLLRKAR